MHIASAYRTAEIEKLGLSNALERFLVSLDVPKGMQSLFNAPYYFYSEGSPDNPGDWRQFPRRVLLPLWENGKQVFAADLAQKRPEYIAFYLEAPCEHRSFGHSIFAALFHMLGLHVWEYGGGEQELQEAIELAKRLGFPNSKALEVMLSDPNCPESRVNEYLAQIV